MKTLLILSLLLLAGCADHPSELDRQYVSGWVAQEVAQEKEFGKRLIYKTDSKHAICFIRGIHTCGESK